MKSIIGIIALLLVNVAGFANSNINTQPELKVMAKSGLKLRLAPNLDSPVIDIVNYGSTLEKVEDFESARIPLKINWVEGKWIKVKYNDQVGFVFDGFISPLAAPMDNNEFSQEINDLSYSLYSWAFKNFELGQVDTLSNTDYSTSTITKLGGEDFFMHASDQVTRVEFTLSGIRIMDAYHLLESMMDTRSARSILKENSTFFENAAGRLNKIKISDQVEIRMLKDGKIKIKCQSTTEGC